MKELKPNLNDEIVPNKSAAGFTLNMPYDIFKDNAKFKAINENQQYDLECKDESWYLFQQDRVSPWNGKHLNDIYCIWKNIVTLIFDGNEFILKMIIVENSYEGKLFKKLGIGSKLEVLKDDFDFLFEGDLHYLVEKNWVNEKDQETYPGIEIRTDYLVSYQEWPEQTVQRIGIYL